MSIDAQRIFDRLSNEPDRGQQTLYLDRDLWRRFKDFCHKQEVSAGRVLEELMREAIETQPKKTQDKR